MPLLPPSPQASSLAAIGVQEVVIQPTNTHQQLLSSLALTYTASSDDVADVAVSEGATTNKQEDAREWSLLLASVSASGHGLLVIHQLPISAKEISTDPEHRLPIQSQRLRLSSSNVKLEFNNSAFPAIRHSIVSLTVPEQRCVKLYQIFHRPSATGARRGSTTTTSSASSVRPSRGSDTKAGKFLVTLSTAFLTEQDGDNISRRRRILDSAWINNGRAIMVLLEDGEWGVWQIEQSTTGQQNGTLARSQSGTSTIQGGSITRFSLHGSVSSNASKTKTNKLSQAAPNSVLAPMTPHTRKVRSEGLFQGSKATQSPQSDAKIQSRGWIAVTKCLAKRPKLSSSYDEALVLTYKDINHHVPSVESMLRVDSSKKGSIESSFASRFHALPSVPLSGGEISHVELLPYLSGDSDAGLFGVTPSRPAFLVSTAFSIILSLPPLPTSSVTLSDLTISKPLMTGGIVNRGSNTDQVLLDQGELDVEGMDRMLNNMASRGTTSNLLGDFGASKNNFGKSVNFQIEEDDDDPSTMDVDAASPTPARSMKRASGPPRTNAGRKLFT